MATIKALIPGMILTLVLSGTLHAAGTRLGVLAIEKLPVADFHLSWSWPLFLVIFGLSRALIWMLDS